MQQEIRQRFLVARRRGVTRLDGARGKTSLAPPWSNLSSFGSKFTVLMKVLVTFSELFRASRSNSAPGELFPPCLPSLHSWIVVILALKFRSLQPIFSAGFSQLVWV